MRGSGYPDHQPGLDGHGAASGDHAPRPALGAPDASGTTEDYVWVWLISGAVPPAHLIDGFRGASSERQPPMYFRLGGGTLKGVSKPGEVVWSRIFVANDALHMIWVGARWWSCRARRPSGAGEKPRPSGPIMHAVTYGVTRDQMMARHKANHLNVVYAENAEAADRGAAAKASMPRRSASRCISAAPTEMALPLSEAFSRLR